jgi:hypothetical protein
MADSFNEEMIEDAPAGSTSAAAADDVEMGEGSGAAAGAGAEGAAAENPNGAELPFAEGGENDPVPPRVTFAQYLSSPVVTLMVGTGENETILTAHQGLLVQSPYFAEACAEFADDGSVCLSTCLASMGGS